eukprot:g2719.t1
MKVVVVKENEDGKNKHSEIVDDQTIRCDGVSYTLDGTAAALKEISETLEKTFVFAGPSREELLFRLLEMAAGRELAAATSDATMYLTWYDVEMDNRIIDVLASSQEQREKESALEDLLHVEVRSAQDVSAIVHGILQMRKKPDASTSSVITLGSMRFILLSFSSAWHARIMKDVKEQRSSGSKRPGRYPAMTLLREFIVGEEDGVFIPN